jgi:Protein of unknown function (DUF3562)
VPLDDVAQLYAREFATLAAGARITSFLPILATRKVRTLLRQRGHPRCPFRKFAASHAATRL